MPAMEVNAAEWDRRMRTGEAVTIQRAATLLGISRQSVYAMIKRGDLEAFKHPNRRTSAIQVAATAIAARGVAIE